MTFQPVIPFSGYSGWLFLDRTGAAQKEAFVESAAVERITDTFRTRIASITSAEDLVKDRALLSVALGAFGLDDDINNTFFIRKVLEDGTSDPDALANRLADPRYRDLSATFGFGTGLVLTGLSVFADDIIDRYEAKQFEKAVGEQNNDLRLAMNLAPAMGDVLSGNQTDTGRWFAMMGNAPMREVFQTALGFPSSFAALDLDKQLEQFRARSEATFGSSRMEDISSPENQEKLIRLFLLRSETASAVTSTASIALTLLQQA